VEEALAELDRPVESYVRWPFTALTNLLSDGRSRESPFIVPGDVWMVAAFSGGGKTTFLTSLVHEWLLAGVGVSYLGLESPAKTIRRIFSCIRLGLNYNEILDGSAKLAPDWPDVYWRLAIDMERVAGGLLPGADHPYPLAISAARHLRASDLPAIYQEAQNLGSRVIIIDHIDHLGIAESTDIYKESRMAVNSILELSQAYDITTVVATQTNNETVRGSRLAQFHPPQPHHIFMGSHKRFVMAGALGLYRPLDTAATRDDLLAVAEDRADPALVLEPGVMGVSAMKSRYRNVEGRRKKLAVANGRVHDLPERDQFSSKGFR
jgi:hypothetical protein